MTKAIDNTGVTAEWLSDFSPTVQRLLRHRTLLMILPETITEQQRYDLDSATEMIAILRILLVFGVLTQFDQSRPFTTRGILPKPTNVDSAHLAFDFARNTLVDGDPEKNDNSIFDEAMDAFSNYREPYYGSGALFGALTRDAATMQDVTDPRTIQNTPLWDSIEVPELLHEAQRSLAAFWKPSSGSWSFWREWYQGFLDGKPMDWELQRRVALIADPIWAAGPEAVAAEIERIRAEWLAEKTAIGPDAVYNEDTQKFSLDYKPSGARDSMKFVVERVELALANAIEASRGNGLTERSIETVILRRAIETHRGDASQLATAFHDARGALEHNLECKEYPEEPSLLILSNTLFANKEELCDRDPLARKRCNRLEALAQPKTIPQLDRDAALEAPDVLEDIINDDFKDQLEIVADEIATAEKPSKSAVARFTNWITTIQQWGDKAQKSEKQAVWLANLVRRIFEWWPF